MMPALVGPAKNISSAMARSVKVASSSIVPVVVGIIQTGQTYLIAERPQGKPYAGFWEFPGGKIESHESAYQALVRELKEELGIAVMSADPLCIYPHTYPDKKVLLHCWRVTAFEGTPIGKEGQQLCWASHQLLTTKKILEGSRKILVECL